MCIINYPWRKGLPDVELHGGYYPYWYRYIGWIITVIIILSVYMCTELNILGRHHLLQRNKKLCDWICLYDIKKLQHHNMLNTNRWSDLKQKPWSRVNLVCNLQNQPSHGPLSQAMNMNQSLLIYMNQSLSLFMNMMCQYLPLLILFYLPVKYQHAQCTWGSPCI